MIEAAAATASNNAMVRLLPLPDIRDDLLLQYSFKKNHSREDNNRLRPPKLKRNHQHDSNWNRSYSQQANNSGLALTSSTTTAIGTRLGGGATAMHTCGAHAISFRSECNDNSVLINRLNEHDNSKLRDNEFSGTISTQSLDTLGACYDPSLHVTYFEQCFTKLTKLGEGSFGEVFKVRNKDDGLLYAVKMSKQLFRSENYRQERLEEVRRYEQFSGHDNCVRFYRAWEQDDKLFMQMELCRESLEQLLQRQRYIPESQIWSILLDLSLALKSLHDRNLIHLDIKLDNVLIGYDQCCKLADFGLVIDVDKANRHQATEGDSRYIAPEIMRGQFSKAADVFSLGIAMLELTCFLELPANGPLWQKLRNGILPENFFKHVSLQLQNAIRHMMSPNPELRPTVEQILGHTKLVALMQRRQRYAFLTNLRCHFRDMARLVWSKLCNLKNFILRWYSKIHTQRFYRPLKLKKGGEEPTTLITKYRTANLFASTPRRLNDGTYSDNNIVDNNSFEDFDLDALYLCNSTPSNKPLGTSCRSRKDLSKILCSSKDTNGSLDKTKDRDERIMSLDEAEESSDLSFLRKKLFQDF